MRSAKETVDEGTESYWKSVLLTIRVVNEWNSRKHLEREKRNKNIEIILKISCNKIKQRNRRILKIKN